jgi:hypothetical protein
MSSRSRTVLGLFVILTVNLGIVRGVGKSNLG